MRALTAAALAFALAGGCAAGPAITPDPSGGFRAAAAPDGSRLTVYVAGESEVPLLGESVRDAKGLLFRPRFPLRAGTEYRAVLSGPSGTEELRFTLPPPPDTPPTRLLRVFPTRDLLPENQLKFYLHFSAPMARGEAYRRVSLVQADGRKVELPFLELGEELWDRSGMRLTLLFDPGRIKSGLRPREEEGPALLKGMSYVLVVDPAWTDAAGRPLAEGHRKRFRAGEADERQPDPARWTVQPPRAGTLTPLSVAFDEPLDSGLLARVFDVRGPDDRSVEGRVEIDREETRWSYVPAAPWKAGAHALVVDTILEDLAGNSLDRPFEVDVVGPFASKPVVKTLRLPFTIPK